MAENTRSSHGSPSPATPGEVNFAKGETGVATITFSHPSRNALPGQTLAELAEAFDQAGRDPGVNVVVLASGGDRAFCAGASFDEFSAISNEAEGTRFFSGFARVINAMRACPKFILGRVQGKAVGGGVGLAAATDYCLATQYAAVKLSELAFGIGPFVVGPAVMRKIGAGGLAELAIDAESWRSAEWALAKGLYAGVFDSADELDEAVYELAHRLCRYNPEAMQTLKQHLWAGYENWEELLPQRAALSGKLVLSEFTTRALEAFRNRKDTGRS